MTSTLRILTIVIALAASTACQNEMAVREDFSRTLESTGVSQTTPETEPTSPRTPASIQEPVVVPTPVPPMPTPTPAPGPGAPVMRQPTVSFSANPLIVKQNEKSVLTWTSQNAAFCTNPAGDNKANGTFTTPALNSTSTFTVTCFGAVGSGFESPMSKSITVTVEAPPVSASELPKVRLVASEGAIFPNDSVTLAWSSTNATKCTTPWSANAPTSGSHTVNGIQTTQTFVVSCASPAGTGNATVFVVVNPRVALPDPKLASVKHRLLNLEKVLLFENFFGGGRYERFHTLTVLKGASAKIPFYSYDWITQKNRPFVVPTYRLLVDGVERATLAVTAAQSSGEFTLDLQNIAEGWHELDIVGGPDEQAAVYPIYVQKSATPQNFASMPFYMGNYTLAHISHGPYFWGTVPTRFTPTVVPFEQRETPAFNTPLARKDLVYTHIAPSKSGDQYRPNVTADGLMTTMNIQNYFFSDLIKKMPKLPLLDGPRGQGNVVMATHIQLGRSGNIYFTDPWRVGKITPDGHIKTLAGYRHKDVPHHYKDAASVELVGDWSKIPIERRGFHEIWGTAWDKGTLGLNLVSALINGELPHISGPKLFVADSQNNRVVLLTFSPISHDVEPTVTEFITGLQDPWDVASEDGVLYVSERTGHRISAYDSTTGKLLRVLVQGEALATVDFNRFVKITSDLTSVRAQPVVAPEGLYLHKGWLYFGSSAMRQVKRINLKTGVIELVTNVTMDQNSNYAKFAISDGTFGPEGTVFVTSWSVASSGFPVAYLPDGTTWNYTKGTGEKGLPWGTNSYAAAVAVGQGKMIFGNANEGLRMISKALPTDVAIDMAKYNAGHNEYVDKGWNVLYGQNGWGYYGLALPWGQSSNVDYYLMMHGHKKK